MALTSKLFLAECKFLLGVGQISQIPQDDIPNFLFWGRSNVGKSSLINLLVNRKNLARVSNTPGRTKEINYFHIQNKLYLVDLPGYGYAKVSLDQKMLWNDLIIKYLHTAINIKRIFLLIDAKVGFKAIDMEVMDFLNYYGLSFQIVFTKTDKITKLAMDLLASNTKTLIKTQSACIPDFIITSFKKKIGFLEIQTTILKLLSSI